MVVEASRMSFEAWYKVNNGKICFRYEVLSSSCRVLLFVLSTARNVLQLNVDGINRNMHYSFQKIMKCTTGEYSAERPWHEILNMRGAQIIFYGS